MMKKPIFTALLLLLSVAFTGSVYATNATVSVGDYEVVPGEQFTVTVNADQLDDVLSYSFRMSYDTSILNVTSVTAGDYMSACGTSFSMPASSDGVVGFDVACLGATVSTGTSFASVTFTALAAGNSTLDIYDSDIRIGREDPTSADITEDDGLVVVSVPAVSVSAGTYNVTVTKPLVVTVSAGQTDDVLSYSFRMSYDTSILNLTSVSVGDYLSSCSSAFSTPIEGAGYVGIDAACLGETVATSGTTLAVITFQPLAVGTSSLDLYESNMSVGINPSYFASVVEVDGTAVVHEVTQDDGDADGDGHVGYTDLTTLAFSYNSSEGSGNYNANADFNGDGVIDYFDLLILAQNYETT